MKMMSFAGRNAKEILRDPLTLAFGIGFPVMLLLILSAIQTHIPVEMFTIEKLAPGMAVFGLSFMTLFSAQVIAKDRESTFLLRLYATPMTAWNFILGYTLPMLPMALLQSVVCFLVAIPLGLPVTVRLIPAILSVIPAALFFIGLGLLFGSILGTKQVGGLCGALITNLTAFLSGIWFDLSLVGEGFEAVAEALPFVHAVRIGQMIQAGETGGLWVHFLWVGGYALTAVGIAVGLFLRQMKRN